MEMYSGKSLSADFDNSMQKLRNGSDFPTLREIYAASEMLNRKILLVKNICGENRAIAICPVLLGLSKETEPIEIEMNNDNNKPTFRCLSLDESVAEKRYVINEGHEFCLDKRFRNSFELLRDANYFPSYKYIKQDSFFEIFGTLIYGVDSLDNFDTSNVDIVKMCLSEHENDKNIKEIYSDFVDIDTYSNVDERKKYEETNEEKKKLRSAIQQKGLAVHLVQWKSLTQGDFFAISSIFGFILYLEEDQKWHMIHPLCGEMMQTIKGSFSLRRISKDCFEVDETLTEHKTIKCLCQVQTPTVSGMLNDAECLISDRIKKDFSKF